MSKEEPKPRYERVDTCGECKACNGRWCEAARVPKMRKYGGIRFTSDGFDCALPVTIDSHSMCSFGCLYCFSDNLKGHVEIADKPIGQTSLGQIERIFSGEGGKFGEQVRLALKYDRRNGNGYPCPVQLGGINDPTDNIERQQGWLLKFIDLAIKYNQPVRISTKGKLLKEPEYLKALGKAPHLFWIAFSIISPDDELMRRIDVRAPLPSERIATMKALSEIGCSTSLRFRPIFPGISDRTKRYPRAYKALVEMAAEAGAKACSFECGFYPSRIPNDSKYKWERLEKLSGVPLKKLYSSFGRQACTRPTLHGQRKSCTPSTGLPTRMTWSAA